MSDPRFLIQVPGWMAPSSRRAGYAATVLGRIVDALDSDWEVLYDAMAEFSDTDPLTWADYPSAETEFLDRYAPGIAALQSGENEGARVLRLLSFERLRGQENPAGLVLLPWVLSALLGRVSEAYDPFGSAETITGTYLFTDDVPTPQAVSFVSGIQSIPAVLGNADCLIGNVTLAARPQGAVYGGGGVTVRSRFSPFSRTGIPPCLLTADVQPLPSTYGWVPSGPLGERCAAVSSPGQTDLTVTREARTVVARAGGYRRLEGSQTGLTAVTPFGGATLVRAKTPADARLRGDTDIRVPGAVISSALVAAITGRQGRHAWSDTGGFSGGAVPLDLDDAGTRFDSPSAYTGVPLGQGTQVPALTRQDHFLATDFG